MVRNDLVKTDRDRYCRKQKETEKGRPSSGFYVLHETEGTEEDQYCHLQPYISVLSLIPADGEAEPSTKHSSADKNMCCLQGERIQHNKSNHLVNCPLKSQLFHLSGRLCLYVRLMGGFCHQRTI